jgi:hypothetical protein
VLEADKLKAVAKVLQGASLSASEDSPSSAASSSSSEKTTNVSPSAVPSSSLDAAVVQHLQQQRHDEQGGRRGRESRDTPRWLEEGVDTREEGDTRGKTRGETQHTPSSPDALNNEYEGARLWSREGASSTSLPLSASKAEENVGDGGSGGWGAGKEFEEEWDFGAVLKKAGAVLDDRVVSHYPKYVSFLAAQAKTPAQRSMCVVGFGLGHVPLHLLLSSSTWRVKQSTPLVVAIDPLSTLVQMEAARFLASLRSCGHRFVALKGNVANQTRQLIERFPSFVCGIVIIIPDGLVEKEGKADESNLEHLQAQEELAEMDAENKLRNLVLCAGALTLSRLSVEKEIWGDGGRGVDERQMLVMDGWPCRTRRCALIGRVWKSLVQENVLQEVGKYGLESGRHGFSVARYLHSDQQACV